MPDREEKHSILPSHHTADFKEHGVFAALEAVKGFSASILSLEDISTSIVANTRTALNVNCAAVWLVDDLHKHLFLQSFSCVDSGDTNPKKYNISLEDEDSPPATCFKECRSSIHKKYTLAEIDPRSATLTKTYVSGVLPLLTPGGVIGVFEILTAHNDPIHSAELEALEVLASQIAMLLSNHQHTDHVSRQSALQKQLYEITTKINQAKDYESILRITVEELCAALYLPGASMKVNMAADVNIASDKEQGL
ncbi:MAG: hypothetical protein C0410_04805 [Anaerolinea sp.]|nr:hypothetical protein [Anaerolinea sp.]